MSEEKQSAIQAAKNFRRELIFINIALIVLGLLMIIFPEVSGEIICRAVGAALAVWGVIRVVTYFVRDKSTAFGSFALVQGAALLGFGVYFLIKPEFLASFLTVILAIVLFIGGVTKLQYSIDLARFKVKLWWIGLIGVLLMIAVGVVALLNPFEAAKTLMIFIGASLVLNGIWDLVTILCLSSIIKKTGSAA